MLRPDAVEKKTGMGANRFRKLILELCEGGGRFCLSATRKDTVMKKNPIMIAGISLMALLAAGCNTVEGAGEDVEATGEAIEETANDAGA